MVPFFQIFGFTWLGFGIYAIVFRPPGGGSALLSGGSIALLGVMLLLRAWVLRRQVARQIKSVTEDRK